MTLPTFLIIGAPKCGTTTLYDGFQQHPDVFMSDPKEPNFLTLGEPRPVNKVVDVDDYARLFAPGAGYSARGEASTAYLQSERAPQAAATLLPDARLLVLLRDPVARAYSAWAHLRQRGREPIADLASAVEAEPERTRRGAAPALTRYVEAGHYAAHLDRWLQHFAREQVLVHLTEDLHARPRDVMRESYAHVGVAPDFAPNLGVRLNRSGTPRVARVARLVNQFGTTLPGRIARRATPDGVRHRTRARIAALNLKPPPPLGDDAYELLAPRFATDIERLRELLGRDLSEWRTTRHLIASS